MPNDIKEDDKITTTTKTVTPRIYELLMEEEPDWVAILQETSADDTAANFIHPMTKFTPLHLAVMAKNTSNNTARIETIRCLLQADSSAAAVQCQRHGYTPLMYACIINDWNHLEHDVIIVKLLMEYGSYKAFTRKCYDQHHSALDLHIVSMSRLLQGKFAGKTNKSALRRNCTKILKVLSNHYRYAKDYLIDISQTLDLLFACNSLQILEHVAQAEAHYFALQLQHHHGRSSKHSCSATRLAQNFWVWEFVITILRSFHEFQNECIRPLPPFNALHTASQIPNFPPAFYTLCMRMYPKQIDMPCADRGDLPLHAVARWKRQFSIDSLSRKALILTQLVRDHPTTCHVCNYRGKTPFKLALESKTPWNHGLDLLDVDIHSNQSVHNMNNDNGDSNK